MGWEKIVRTIGTKKKELILFFFSFVSSFFLAAIAYDLYFQKTYWHDTLTQFDKELGWDTIPSSSITLNGKTYTTDSLGFRSPEIDSSNKPRILVLGDSVIWGPEINDDETFVSFLQKRLPGYQVVNAGVSGYGIDQYYLKLKNIVDKINPKVIIVAICSGNDFEDTQSDERYGKSKPLFVFRGGELVETNVPVSRFSCSNVYSKSWLLSSYPLNRLKKIFCRETVLDQDATKAVIKDLLKKISALAKQNGSKITFMISPSKLDFVLYACKGALSKACSGIQAEGGKFLSEMVNETKKNKRENYGLKSINRYYGNRSRVFEFEEILKESPHVYLDFLLSLANADVDIAKFYVDNNHYSRSGNQFLGDTVYEFLKNGQMIE